MRALSNTVAAILDAPSRMANTLVRVSIKDSGGTFRDLTTYPEDNFVLSVQYGDDIDSNGPTARVTLQKAYEAKSLAPLMDDSPLNLGFNPAATPSALLFYGRAVKIEVAVLPEGKPVQSGDWFEVFRGQVDGVDIGDDTIVVTCRDQVATLQDTWIEDERMYAYCQGANAVKGAYVFKLGQFYALNALVTPSNGKQNGHFYKVTTSGTTGATEPTWPTGSGSTVASGTATFTEVGSISPTTGTAVETVMQQIIDDNLGSGVVTLYTPASPGWSISAFTQQRQSVWDAVRALANQIGWDLRFKWRSGTAQFELTFSEPDRAKTTPDYTFGTEDEWKLQKLAGNIHDIRNAVRIVWTDPTSTDAQGTGTRSSQTYTDPTSISTYGRRFMEVQEGKSSNIDTGTEASTLSTALLSDLSTPKIDRAGQFEFFPLCELGDLYRFAADNINYTSDQDLAVVSYSHDISADGATTTIAARGQPAGGFHRWLASLQAIPDESEIHRLNPLLTSSIALSTGKAIGGQAMRVAAAEIRGNGPMQWEYHCDTASGFTPSASTLRTVTTGRHAVITDLTPGETYYGVAIPIFFNDNRIIRGLPTEQVTFVAYQADAAQLSPKVDWGRLPLNGGFETSVDGGTSADHWTAYSGSAWGAEAVLKDDTEAKTGGTYLKLTARNGGTADVHSALWGLDASSVWGFSGWLRVDAIGVGTNGTLTIEVEYFDTTGSSVGTETLRAQTCSASTGWLRFDTTNHPDALGYTSATQARINIGLTGPGTSGNAVVSIDSISATCFGEPWVDVDAGGTMPNGTSVPAFLNSWVNFGGSTTACAFRIDRNGVVHLKGTVKSGTVGSGTPIFTLPAGYRPPEEHSRAVDSNNAFGRVIVTTGGDVALVAGSNTYTSLDGISFATW